MSTIRQQIVEALITRIEGIQTSASYLTNLGDVVILNAYKGGDALAVDQTLAAIIREMGCVQMAGMASENFGTLELEVSIVATAIEDDNPQDTARDAHADLVTAIGTDKTFDGLVDDTVLNSAEFNTVKKGKNASTIIQKMKMNFRTQRWDLTTAAT